MRGEWCYYKSFFPKEACEYIISEALKLPEQDGTVGTADGVQVDEAVRKSKIRFIDKSNATFTNTFSSLWTSAIEANEHWFGFHISRLQFIQFAEYKDIYKGEYKKHQDVFWINEEPHHRKLSCIVQLSEPDSYEGGDFELYGLTQNHPDRTELKMQGTTLFFPSFTDHALHPVTKGTRYSLAAWFEGPKWR
jgi:PKHD-type hydroxylase